MSLNFELANFCYQVKNGRYNSNQGNRKDASVCYENAISSLKIYLRTLPLNLLCRTRYREILDYVKDEYHIFKNGPTQTDKLMNLVVEPDLLQTFIDNSKSLTSFLEKLPKTSSATSLTNKIEILPSTSTMSTIKKTNSSTETFFTTSNRGNTLPISSDPCLKKKEHHPEGDNSDKMLLKLLRNEIMRQRKISWDDVVGLTDLKRALKILMLPKLLAQHCSDEKQWIPALLFGPNGAGKSFLVKALAAECKTTLFNVSLSKLISKNISVVEKAISVVFEKAKSYTSSIIFIDELDLLCNTKSKTLGSAKEELLKQVDKIIFHAASSSKRIVVLAASNAPWWLDTALRRRFQTRIYVPLPTKQDREALLKLHLKNVKLHPKVNLSKVAASLDGYSSAQVANICHEVSMFSIRQEIYGLSKEEIQQLTHDELDTPVTTKIFNEVIDRFKKTVLKQNVFKYEAWFQLFGTF